MYGHLWNSVSFATSNFRFFLLIIFFLNSFNTALLAARVQTTRQTYGFDGQGITRSIFTNGVIDPHFFHGVMFTFEVNSMAVNIACKFWFFFYAS